MSRKDIALTVGGVLATMVVAYLIYKMQQRDAVAAASSSAASSSGEAYQVDGDTSALEYAALLSQVAGPMTGVVSNVTGAVSSSADTATTGATGTSIDSSDVNDLMSQIIADFAGSITSSSSTPETVASMTIPNLTGAGASDLSNVPVTAGQANAGAAASLSPAGTTIVNSQAPFMASMQSSAIVSSHPVAQHPVVQSPAVN